MAAKRTISSRPSEERVAAALAAVLQTGSVAQAAEQVDVPERTLRGWRASAKWADTRAAIEREHGEAAEIARQATAAAWARTQVSAALAAEQIAESIRLLMAEEHPDLGVVSDLAKALAQVSRSGTSIAETLARLIGDVETSRVINVTVQPTTAVPAGPVAVPDIEPRT